MKTAIVLMSLAILVIVVYCIYWSVREIKANKLRDEELDHKSLTKRYFERKKREQDAEIE